jgi:uncharacterized protein
VATNIQYEIPTWNQIYDMLLDQVQKIHRQNSNPEILVGVGRGGAIPARILADLLETPNVASIQIEFYTDIAQTRAEPTLKQALTIPVYGKKVLLVDDIADSGKSLLFAKNHIQRMGAREIQTATLYLKPTSITVPDFYEKQTSNWVVFPWETKETLRKIIQRQLGKRALNQEIVKLVKSGLPKRLAEKLLIDMQ